MKPKYEHTYYIRAYILNLCNIKITIIQNNIRFCNNLLFYKANELK